MNAQALSDLDELVFLVRDKESGRLIAEAVAAYRGGALRAATMSVWIAVAYDIIAKARELASQGESAPKQFIAKLETAIAAKDLRRLQAIESELLITARDEFQFFTPHEFIDLERLQSDRNLCAHPAFVSEDSLFQPSPELARTHIVHAIQHLLRHAPLQGKSAIGRLDADILGASFPTAPAEIETFLRQRYLERAKDSLVVALIRGLITCPLGSEHAKYVGRERQVAHSLAAIGRIKPAIFEREAPAYIQKKANEAGDDRILAFVRVAAAEPLIWTWIGEAAQLRIKTLADQAQPEEIKAFDLFDGLDISGLRDILLEKFKKLDSDLQQNIIAERPRTEFADRALELYAHAVSFRHSEALGQSVILPMAPYFMPEHIDKVLLAVEENGQIQAAAGSPAIIEELYDKTTHLLPQTGQRWRRFVSAVGKDKDRSDFYAYPGIRGRLIKAGIMQR